MKAFVVEKYGKDGLRAADVPEPTVGRRDVLVRVSAASINPLDKMTRNGEFKRLIKHKPPFVLGHDMAGVVTEVGADVHKLKICYLVPRFSACLLRRGPANSRRPLLPARLLRPAPRPHRLPAGVLARPRPGRAAHGARQQRRRRAAAPVRRALRPDDRLPGLVRPGRERVAAAARRGAAGERPRQPLDDRAHLRRQPAHPARAVRPARHRRCARARGARHPARRRAPERGPPGARGARAGGRHVARRHAARQRARAGAQARGLHDAHARRGRQRELPAGQFVDAFGELARRLGISDDEFLDLCRVVPGEGDPGMSALAMRMSSRRNGVSRVHGEVAREMWKPMFPGASRRADRPRHQRRAPRRRISATRCTCCSPGTSASAGCGTRADPESRGRRCARSRTTSSGRRAPRRGGGSPSSRAEGRAGPAAARRGHRVRPRRRRPARRRRR